MTKRPASWPRHIFFLHPLYWRTLRKWLCWFSHRIRENNTIRCFWQREIKVEANINAREEGKEENVKHGWKESQVLSDNMSKHEDKFENWTIITRGAWIGLSTPIWTSSFISLKAKPSMLINSLEEAILPHITESPKMGLDSVSIRTVIPKLLP